MKLKQLHGNPPQKKRVWQREEHQGAASPKHWYQTYSRKAKPYRQSHTLGPKPEGYEEHILRPGA